MTQGLVKKFPCVDSTHTINPMTVGPAVVVAVVCVGTRYGVVGGSEFLCIYIYSYISINK